MQCKICKKNHSRRGRSKGSFSLYCSIDCYKKNWYLERHINLPNPPKKCEYCLGKFQPGIFSRNAKFCSSICYIKIYLIKNRKKINIKNAKWIKNNKEKVRSYHRKNYQNFILKKRALAKARSTGHIKLQEWIQLCEKSNNKCLHCGIKGDYNSLSIDHIIPFSLGGSNDITNLQPLCLKCNQKKGNRFIG